jgi:hypothetical protein
VPQPYCAVVVPRPRHPRPELETVLRSAEAQSWRVTKGKKYFKMWCPCPERHMKTVKLTPSNPNYSMELKKKLERSTCWKEQ